MIKIIQRKSDNKYLQSVENDLWVDNISEAYEMSLIECVEVKKSLSTNYKPEDIKEILNLNKVKIASKEEKKKYRDILKNK
jgi:hypothetical protein